MMPFADAPSCAITLESDLRIDCAFRITDLLVMRARLLESHTGSAGCIRGDKCYSCFLKSHLDLLQGGQIGAHPIFESAEEIPNTYWLPQPPKLDRQTVLGKLKGGAEIPGAQLSNPKPLLMVRTK